ncbi:sensor domain-containing diguanylate cyclase [Rhizobium sp. RU36D]|uniref:GGDEF domain-containing protein n=1 Tax=Rhizobium sp. RU36D TaxID=1907415 RepID=UPI0009D8A8E4|nr:sensor domain-containing diguanylate cyclase [Rhizobium sp. RU36D]SMD17109.1 PAS domain S-box-containing protein/diguanylate cyclase (GGDEF) domain-containing protein [Rhizobium sp. RU36D]
MPNNDLTVLDEDIFGKIVWEMDDGIVAIDVHGVITFCNPSVERLFGHSPGYLTGKPLDVLLPHRFRRNHGSHLAAFLKGSADTAYMGSRKAHILGLRADGTEVRLGATILRTQTMAGPIMVAVMRDLTERLSYQSELERLANTDPLTGIYNRRAFTDAAGQHLAEANRTGGQISLMLFDIDHFKSINDRHGHDTGDQVIRDFARIISSILQGEDIAARWGGEEFIVAMPHTGLDRAVLMAEMVRRNAEIVTFSGSAGQDLRLTISAGVVCSCAATEDLESLIKHADNALYAAKDAGRNTVTALMSHWPMPAHFALHGAIG